MPLLSNTDENPISFTRFFRQIDNPLPQQYLTAKKNFIFSRFSGTPIPTPTPIFRPSPSPNPPPQISNLSPRRRGSQIPSAGEARTPLSAGLQFEIFIPSLSLLSPRSLSPRLSPPRLPPPQLSPALTHYCLLPTIPPRRLPADKPRRQHNLLRHRQSPRLFQCQKRLLHQHSRIQPKRRQPRRQFPAHGSSPHPTTDTSSGTRSPARTIACIAPAAVQSSAANTAPTAPAGPAPGTPASPHTRPANPSPRPKPPPPSPASGPPPKTPLFSGQRRNPLSTGARTQEPAISGISGRRCPYSANRRRRLSPNPPIIKANPAPPLLISYF